MGCCSGEREKGPPEQTARWEYITLTDFKATSSWTTVAYIWLWIMGFVGVAVYGVDTFTAVNLLVFDRWSSQVDPYLDLKYSKWIFAGCILLSWALFVYEAIRALRAIKRGGVAESYMEPLAAQWQSMRPQGWRRFLVFTELTKSKKGADYVAFFVYFTFHGAIRIIFAEGPRQVINGLTLYSVMQARIVDGDADDEQANNIEQFFSNVKSLADENTQQAVILFAMLFTLIIWVISALCLIISGVLYLAFLWHYIPQRDGRLKIYCRRKVDKRLEKIVEHKVKAAIEEEQKKKEKAEQKAEQRAELRRQKTGEPAPFEAPKMKRQPTIPQLGGTPDLKQDDKMGHAGLERQDTSTTVSTLPVYTSRPPTRQGIQRQPTLPDMAEERPSMPVRSVTQGSDWSNYDPDAPLLPNAGPAGYAAPQSRTGSPAPTYYSRQDSNASMRRAIPPRTMTGSAQSSQGSQMPMPMMSRMHSNGPQRGPPMSRNDSYQSRGPPGQRFPVGTDTGYSYDSAPPSAGGTGSPAYPYGHPAMHSNTQDSFAPPQRYESPASYLDQSAIASPPLVMDRSQPYESFHGQRSSFGRSQPPPQATRQPSHSSNFSGVLSPPAMDNPRREHMPTAPPDSYEMTTQPTHRSITPPRSLTPGTQQQQPLPPPPRSLTPGTSQQPQPSHQQQQQQPIASYVAFKPTAAPAPSASAPPPCTESPPSFRTGAQRAVQVTTPDSGADYFGGAQSRGPQRSVTAPVDQAVGNRAVSGYGDILDDYESDDGGGRASYGSEPQRRGTDRL